MPRPFEAAFDSPASVEQIHSAFGRRAYWQARIAAFGGDKTLSALEVEPDGTVTTTVAEDLRHGSLPGILAKLYRGDLKVVSTETWRRAGERRVSGEISVAVSGAPGSGRGAAMLAPVGEGSQLTISGIVEFNVPLVGGRIETYVAAQFVAGLQDIQDFTTAWTLEHA